ncbi:hypothetical protein CXB51_001275 [Gossypium anomalum]|uniref:Uncharacterized protein n=1 Tax=Gossypium anomalum TaxID=47600 RepID=A0A8J5ZBE4_9ROSI|nr:hypothetical protein CXB51_001275 [Gossypium anomalum]
MISEGVTAQSQKDVKSLQQDVSKLQQDFSQLEYLGRLSALSSVRQPPDKGKGVLGGPPPSFPPKEPQSGHSLKDPLPSFAGIDRGTFAQWGNHKLECPKFDDTGFRGWWAKLTQYFEAERVPSTARVKTNPMADLVTLKQQISLLNQVQLPESCAVSIFSSNLKSEIIQYMQLFKPKSSVEGFLLARQVENILNHSLKCGFLLPCSSPGRSFASITMHGQSSKNQQIATLRVHNMGTMGSGNNSSSASAMGSSKGVNKTLSLAEIEERRRKELSFLVRGKIWCRS